ncbi:unnamed protein product, partial [marine sediment metagenome]
MGDGSVQLRIGTVMPEEYNWRSTWDDLDLLKAYAELDTGKVHGLAVALSRANARIKDLRELIGR